jgi:hypothetical protein
MRPGSDLVRRAVIAVGIGVLAASTLAPSVAAGAEGAIRPGSQWTFRLHGGGCEIDTFHAGGTFSTAGRDRGTFTTRGNHLRMLWTRGGNATTSFTGTFTPSVRGYSGLWKAGIDEIPATLTPGRSCP